MPISISKSSIGIIISGCKELFIDIRKNINFNHETKGISSGVHAEVSISIPRSSIRITKSSSNELLMAISKVISLKITNTIGC